MNTTIVSYIAGLVGHEPTPLVSFLIYFAACFLLANICMAIGGLATYAERKISADIQARIGPNRVGPYGLLQFIADAVKMILKEDVSPIESDRFLFYLAPFMALIGVFLTLAVLPISSGLAMTQLNVGVFYILAVSSLVGLAVFLGGYASNSKWSMLGGMRGASQIISYEIPVTISILMIVMLSGGMNFNAIVGSQSSGWFIFHNPFTFIGFFIYFIASLRSKMFFTVS